MEFIAMATSILGLISAFSIPVGILLVAAYPEEFNPLYVHGVVAILWGIVFLGICVLSVWELFFR